MGFLVRGETKENKSFPPPTPATFPPIDLVEEFRSLAPRMGTARVNDFNNLAESGTLNRLAPSRGSAQSVHL
jgi:hypothetical protein